MFDSRIIVAGSRGYFNTPRFDATVKHYVENVHEGLVVAFISGMARTGADRLIYEYCKVHGHRCFEFPARWDVHGLRAGYIRNTEMGDEATHLLAFWDGESKGTASMIRYAARLGLVVHIAEISARSAEKHLHYQRYELGA